MPSQSLAGHCNLDPIDQHCSDLNFKQPAILNPLSPSSEANFMDFIGKKALATHKLRISEEAVNTNRINFN